MTEYKVIGCKYGRTDADLSDKYGSREMAKSFAKSLNAEKPSLKARVVTVKTKAPKYKLGDMLYSYQNRDKPARVVWVHESDDATYDHKYILQLPDGRSNHIDESSLAKTKNAKKLN